MSNKPAKSQGNASRRAGQRNNGLPSGVKRAGGINRLDNMEAILLGAGSLYEMNRRLRMFRNWNVSFGRRESTRSNA